MVSPDSGQAKATGTLPPAALSPPTNLRIVK
jgi:hypothetical protein